MDTLGKQLQSCWALLYLVRNVSEAEVMARLGLTSVMEAMQWGKEIRLVSSMLASCLASKLDK